MKNQKGFLVLEMLIAGLILTASIAAAMYLFKIGAENLERVNNSNFISAKLPQAINLLHGVDLDKANGAEELGDGVWLRWKSKLLEEYKPVEAGLVAGRFARATHDLYLFQVDFSLEYEDRLKREYSIHVLRAQSIRAAAAPL